MKSHLHLFLILSILLSCEDSDEARPENEFNVTVAGTGIDCKLPLIDFLVTDSARIKNITGLQGLRYQVINLDSALTGIGTELNIKVRALREDEVFYCTTLGLWYPWAVITEAKVTE